MSLITGYLKSFPYIVCKGSSMAETNRATENLSILASSVIDSNGITATSSSRLTFTQSGWYEFDIPIQIGFDTGDSAVLRTITLYYGINGSWVNILTSHTAKSVLGGKIVNLILSINSGDYFEMKTVLSGAIGTSGQHFNWASGGQPFSYDSIITIKRIY